MICVALFDQNDTHFATFDMPELPRTGDVIEIGFRGEQVVKTFVVERVVHKMVPLPTETKNDLPWHWELQLHGYLEKAHEDLACACAQGVTKCPKHGEQPAERDTCPLCGKAVLGYCQEGEYCTDEGCKYVA